MKYIAKPVEHGWYISYSLVELQDDYRKESDWDTGLFRGWRMKQFESEGGDKIGEKYYDGEVCSFDEFWELTDEEYIDFCKENNLSHDTK